MARALRIEYEGALYHTFSRGNEQRDIFLEDDDRLSFLKAIGEMSQRFDVDIFAYVLMGNHYHLLLRTRKANLSKSMHWLGSTYTRRFNLRHLRNGHLFQGRFKSILVQNEAYLMQLSCYIHRNPLRAGISNRLAAYPWSSYRVYAYEANHPEWLNTKLILTQFKEKDPHRAYREKVQKYSEEENQIWENLRYGLVFGTKRFLEQIKTDHLSEEPDAELPQLNRIIKDKNLFKLIQKAAKILNCNIIKSNEPERFLIKDIQDRDLLLHYLRETGLYTNYQIGAFFGITYSAVSRRASIIKFEITKSTELERKYNLIKSKIKV
jgi:REP element-mobilizing transposase RayT